MVFKFFAEGVRHPGLENINPILDKFLLEHENDFNKRVGKAEFEQTMDFVNRYFPTGFAKTEKSSATPRVRFEAISVGVNLALRENPNLKPKSMKWLNSMQFSKHTTTHASNSGPKLRGRVEYVKNQLLKG